MSFDFDDPVRQDTAIGGLLVEAVKVDRHDGGGRTPEFIYCVIETANGDERRSMRRLRTRLQSGKILKSHNAFLIEYQIYDRSEQGARIRLLADILASTSIRLMRTRRNA